MRRLRNSKWKLPPNQQTADLVGPVARTICAMRFCLVLAVAVMACGGKSKPRPTTADQRSNASTTASRAEQARPAAPPAAGIAATPARPPPAAPAGKLDARRREGRDAAPGRRPARQGEAPRSTSGNKNLAEQLFSTAELLVGADALASLAPQFREGAPPRVTTPTIKVDTARAAAAQGVGSSEAEDEADKVPPPQGRGRQPDRHACRSTASRSPARSASSRSSPRAASGSRARRSAHVMEQRGREFNAARDGALGRLDRRVPELRHRVSQRVLDVADRRVRPRHLQGRRGARVHVREGRHHSPRLQPAREHAARTSSSSSAPAYVVTDDKGDFKFNRLAPGKYKLKAWSERSKAPITQDVTIKAGKNDDHGRRRRRCAGRAAARQVRRQAWLDRRSLALGAVAARRRRCRARVRRHAQAGGRHDAASRATRWARAVDKLDSDVKAARASGQGARRDARRSAARAVGRRDRCRRRATDMRRRAASSRSTPQPGEVIELGQTEERRPRRRRC